MRKKVKILVLGSIVYDCVTWGDRLPRKGETVIGYRNGFFTGGKGANQAVQAARMGAEVSMIGRVGNDYFGKILISALKKEGINTKYIYMDNNLPTGTCCIHIDKNGSNAIMVAPQANLAISIDQINRAMNEYSDFDIFLTQLEVNIESTIHVLKLARNMKNIVVFNPAPAHSIPIEVFKYTNYINFNQTETEFFSGILPKDNKTYIEASKRLLKMGVENLIITLGSKGVFFADSKTSYLVPSYKISAVDTTAAGDAFNAAFSVVIGEGKSIYEALLYGNAAGAVAAKGYGSQPSLGYRREIENMKMSSSIKKRV